MRLLHRILAPLPALLRQMVGIVGRLVELFGMLSIAASPLASWILGNINDSLQGLINAGKGGGIERLTAWFESMKPVLEAMWYFLVEGRRGDMGARRRRAAAASPT